MLRRMSESGSGPTKALSPDDRHNLAAAAPTVPPMFFRESLLIILVAFLVRLIPVLHTANWTDLYDQQALPILRHLNIYVVTRGIFPYSPVSMFIPALCAKMSLFFKMPFSVVMRFPCIAADMGIAISLYIIMSKKTQTRAFLYGMLYAINPVAVLIAAFHGNLITIPTLLSFLAYGVLLFGVDNNYRLSALLLGLAIGFRGYPVLLLPFFLVHLKVPAKKKIGYILYAAIPTALSFIPFLILDFKSVLREVFTYSGFTDYGFIAIVRAALSFKYGALLYGLPDNMHLWLTNGSKILFFTVYIIGLFIFARRRLIDSIMFVFASFYFLFGGVSSQYFVWILPFAFLAKDRMLSWYTVVATWALVNFYWIYHPHVLFGKSKPIVLPFHILLGGEIISLSLLWVTCLCWIVILLTKKEEKREGDLGLV